MKINLLLLFLGLTLFSAACRNKNQKNLVYIEQQELSKGIRNDSLFMGLYLGMTRMDFLNHCWNMNKQNLFTEGGNKTVVYQIGKLYSDYSIQMNFYPRFKDDKIIQLPVQFTYKVLDPYNPNMKTEKLLAEVRMLMEKWFGGKFFLTDMPTGGKGYAQVNGNRRILILVEREFEVMVIFTDLTERQ